MPFAVPISASSSSGGSGVPTPIDFGTIDASGVAQSWHATVTLTGSTSVISTGFTNPANPRNVAITDQDSVGTGVFTIHGTDAANVSLSEVIDLSSSAIGAKCFKTITSINCPASNGNHFDFYYSLQVGLASATGNKIIGFPVMGSNVYNSGSSPTSLFFQIHTDVNNVYNCYYVFFADFSSNHFIFYPLVNG